MKTYEKILMWALLPVFVFLGIIEGIWEELKRLVTDSLLVPTIKDNYQRLKQLYTIDIWQ